MCLGFVGQILNVRNLDNLRPCNSGLYLLITVNFFIAFVTYSAILRYSMTNISSKIIEYSLLEDCCNQVHDSDKLSEQHRSHLCYICCGEMMWKYWKNLAYELLGCKSVGVLNFGLSDKKLFRLQNNSFFPLQCKSYFSKQLWLRTVEEVLAVSSSSSSSFFPFLIINVNLCTNVVRWSS